jgi:hypothetical protein
MTTVNITTQNLTQHPDFTTPNFGVIDFGVPAAGQFSQGYKMIAFEPGKILQAQELNEIQFRMNVHQTLTMEMTSNWLNELILYGSVDTTGPGWDGATPISPDLVKYKRTNQTLTIERRKWYLCKANSSGLFFWLYITTSNVIEFDVSTVALNNYVGFTLNTTANDEYTGELVNCNSVGRTINGNNVLHPLYVNETSVCGSSRYYLRITGIQESRDQINNGFVALVQKRQDGFYYLNNIKVKEIT